MRLLYNKTGKKPLWINFLIPIIIYLIGLGVAIGFSMSVDYTAVSDGMREYELYSDIVKTGQWHPVLGIPLSSCVIILYTPAFFQRLLGTEPLLTYKIVHSVMVSFLPVVVYFLARKYVGWKYACISVGLLLAHPYSMWEPKVARLSIALIFFTLMILIVLSARLRMVYKIPLLAVCSAGVVMSHYGTAYASLFILAVSWLIIICLHTTKVAMFRYKIPFTIALCCLIVVSISWLSVVEVKPGWIAKGFVQESLSVDQFNQHSQVINNPSEKPNVTSGEKPNVISSFFDVSSREQVVQAAFGKTLSTANIPQKIEFVFSWLVVLTLSYGVFVAIKKKVFSNEYLVLAGVSYFAILLAVALPHISVYYSVVRIYFQALVILGVCFVVGGVELSKMLKLKPAVVPLFVLIPYTLCTSNILHQFFGVSRWSP